MFLSDFNGVGGPYKSGLSRVSAYSEVVDFRDFEPFVAILGGTSLGSKLF